MVALADDTAAGPSTAPRRAFGFWMALALVVGGMIGSGIFLLPAQIAPFGATGIVAWFVAIGGALTLAWVLTRLTAAMPEEHHVDRRDPLQHFVGTDSIKCGEAVKQRDGDEHQAPAVTVSGSQTAGRRKPAGHSAAGNQSGGSSGARSNGPPAGSSTRAPQRTKSSSGR